MGRIVYHNQRRVTNSEDIGFRRAEKANPSLLNDQNHVSFTTMHHRQSYPYGNVGWGGGFIAFKRVRLDSGLSRTELHESGEICQFGHPPLVFLSHPNIHIRCSQAA